MPRRKKLRVAATQYWVGYCRKSTDTEDKQVHTLADQAKMIEAHYQDISNRLDHPLMMMEEAQSAYRPGRAVFTRILQMADLGQVVGLIVVHPNRVSRNHADSGAFVQRMVDGRIRFLATTPGKCYTGQDSNDIFMLTLEGAMSWKDSRDKGDRIRQAMVMRAAEGRHMGPVRIGYQSVCRPDGSKMLELTEAAPFVRKLFELAATGAYSILHLTREARKCGLVSKAGKAISPSVVHAILRDPLYMGYYRFVGKIVKGQHPALVDAALWEKVQATLKSRDTNSARPKNLGLRNFFYFGGLLKCPSCPRHLCPYLVKGRLVYYECKNPFTKCRVCVPQLQLVKQINVVYERLHLEQAELNALPEKLLVLHREEHRNEQTRRDALVEEEVNLQREIGDLFLGRSKAEAMGVLGVVEARLTELGHRQSEVRSLLDGLADDSPDWIKAVVGSFELQKLLVEAISNAPFRIREMVLQSMSSNLTVDRGKLVLELRSPLCQLLEKGGRSEWYSGLYEVRTEIVDTFRRLQAAYAFLNADSSSWN